MSISFSEIVDALSLIDPCCITYAKANLPIKYHTYIEHIAENCTWSTPTGYPCIECKNIIQYNTLDECLNVLKQTEILEYLNSKDILNIISSYIVYTVNMNERAKCITIDNEDPDIQLSTITKVAKENKLNRADIIIINDHCDGTFYYYIFDGNVAISMGHMDKFTIPKQFNILDMSDGLRNPFYWDCIKSFVVNFNTKSYLTNLLQNITEKDDEYYTQIQFCGQPLRIYAIWDVTSILYYQGKSYNNEDIIRRFKSALTNCYKFYNNFNDIGFNIIKSTFNGLVLYLRIDTTAF